MARSQRDLAVLDGGTRPGGDTHGSAAAPALGVAPTPTQDDAGSAAADLARRGWFARLTPLWPRAWISTAATWSHTPRALTLGAGAAALLAISAGALLLTVGFFGAGTHVLLPPPPSDASEPFLPSEYDLGPFPPIFALPPLPVGPSLPIGLPANGQLADLVLQQADVAYEFHTIDQTALGSDSNSGLLAAYHIVYERSNASASSVLPATVAIFSLVGAYRDVASAAAQLSDADLWHIGADAGLHGLETAAVITARVGDESRVLHLAGLSQGLDVGVYLVQFRRGAVVGIVGVAAPRGTESLDQALALAARQERHVEESVYATPARGTR